MMLMLSLLLLESPLELSWLLLSSLSRCGNKNISYFFFKISVYLQTKWDFTIMGGALVCVLFGLVIFGFVMIFVPYNKYLQMVYGGVGALIFSLYLVYDTQMMMGGDHKYSISPEEYVFAGDYD